MAGKFPCALSFKKHSTRKQCECIEPQCIQTQLALYDALLRVCNRSARHRKKLAQDLGLDKLPAAASDDEEDEQQQQQQGVASTAYAFQVELLCVVVFCCVWLQRFSV